MLTKEIVHDIIEDCKLRMEMFANKQGGNCFGKPLITISLTGVDGGGLSTYGKSVSMSKDTHYECHEKYLYIYKQFTHYSLERRREELHEQTIFIPYEHIIEIRCESTATTK